MPDAPTRPLADPAPSVVALDVNETLSDMSALCRPIEALGAPRDILQAWFTQTLRDGFALAAAGGYADFAAIAHGVLRSMLAEVPGLDRDPDEAAEHVLGAMAELPLHSDVAAGLQRLHASGFRLVALTNGSAETARQLLENSGVADCIEDFLSVEVVKHWKPAPEAYRFAAEACGVSEQQMMLAAVHPWDIDGAKRAGLATAWVD